MRPVSFVACAISSSKFIFTERSLTWNNSSKIGELQQTSKAVLSDWVIEVTDDNSQFVTLAKAGFLKYLRKMMMNADFHLLKLSEVSKWDATCVTSGSIALDKDAAPPCW